MPDKRRHRGAHPDDQTLFADDRVDLLRSAVMEFSWLLTRDYAHDSALKLVGDRHDLSARQRSAVWRSACSDQALVRRQRSHVSIDGAARVGVDGYNLLITLESALSRGVVLVGRDGCYRDLASMHGTYRKVEETAPALELAIAHLTSARVRHVDWYLDRPVSNSGRVKVLLAEMLEPRAAHWNIELVDNPDPLLAAYDGAVVSADSWILDHCSRWSNVAADIIRTRVRDAWRVDLRPRSTP